ncbi:MAG: hypothetical protein ONA69_01190 [candidate division KSB1 bacterium]|nr:hypothetical protein [candidate division KSB1 bacterium]MDZ7345388.1 hypothetical protein [candidate division KSB1 bacterium]
MQLLSRLFENSIDTLWTRISVADTVFILQSLDAENRLNWVVEEGAFSAFSKRGCRVSTKKDPDIAAAVLYYLPASEIEYRYLKKGRINRRIKAEIFFKLATSDGTMPFVDRLCLAESDTISADVTAVENRLWSFTIGSWRRSKSRQWLEFGAASAVTLAVALIFYFYRSQ